MITLSDIEKKLAAVQVIAPVGNSQEKSFDLI
jgi:hypothetical protein